MMRRADRATHLASLLIVFSVVLGSRVEEEVSFNRDVRPILSDKCFVCHGPDASNRQADLRLDVE
ncbi:MAG: hypothetical protein ISR77_32270 [Pirellulaceae bacterium]|nr:hypothetical protein [Pirellulaceae bacterium]